MYVNFSILWWIGVMETESATVDKKSRQSFQYPLVDWGDGDGQITSLLHFVRPISVSSGGLG